MVLTETQHAHCFQESGDEKKDGEETRQCQWKWYFSTGFSPNSHEDVEKKRKNGDKPSKAELQSTREHAGVAFLIRNTILDKVEDVQPIYRS